MNLFCHSMQLFYALGRSEERLRERFDGAGADTLVYIAQDVCEKIELDAESKKEVEKSVREILARYGKKKND